MVEEDHIVSRDLSQAAGVKLEGARHVCMFSGGGGSWRAAKVVRATNPHDDLRLVFVDTLYEDADAYRFLVEGALNVYGRGAGWVPAAEDFPDYRAAPDTPLADYAGNQAWRTFLAQLRDRAAEAVPELTWLVEGRDPWEVFRDERFLGNSRADPCSKFIKRVTLDRWRRENCDPRSTTFYVGLGDHEPHRFDNGAGGGLGPRMAADGWTYRAPLIGLYDVNPAVLMKAEGLAPPRLYAMGYMHNNCGGFCVKAGHAHYRNRAKVHPERFAYDQMMERKVRAYLGTPAATILNDRTGGVRLPLSLDAFGSRIRAGTEGHHEYEPGTSGCGCLTEDAA